MKTLIIQAGFPRSASTLLTNALYGMTPGLYDKPVLWDDFIHHYRYGYDNDVMVIKTHEVNVNKVQRSLKGKYAVYFVCSERRETGNRIDARYRSYPNVAIFDYSELTESPQNPLPAIVNAIYATMQFMIPSITFDREGGLQRVTAMNARYEEIKDAPFSYVDPVFQLHGHHRLRGSRTRLRLNREH